MPAAPTMKPSDHAHAANTIALRGPCRSIQRPPNAADRPSIAMAIEKITPLCVWLISRRDSRGVLKTLNA